MYKVLKKTDDNISYVLLTSHDENFNNVCDFIEQNITKENLNVNGGILHNSGITYDAKFLIIALNNNNIPIAYNSIKQKVEDEYYISQIAVKEDYRRRKIGTNLVQLAIEIAKNDSKNVAAHALYYNDASVNMFESLGFSRSNKLTRRGSFRFTYDTKINDKYVRHR